MQCDAKALIESVSTAILVTDLQFKIIFANTAAEQMLGMSNSKITALKITDFIDPAEKNLLESLNGVGKPSFQGFAAASINFTPDPFNSFQADMYINPYSGKGKGLVVELRSMDYQQKLNNEIHRRSTHLAARDLIRNLAHEIKNPLGGIRGAAQLLEMSYGRNSDVVEYTRVIIEQADRLKSLVDNLLGPQRPNPMAMDNIHYVLEKVLDLESMETQGNISFEKDYDPSIPEFLCDIDALQQALLNIVGNAVQALNDSKTRHPLIKVKTRAMLGVLINGIKYPTSVCISITDNGPGIPEGIRQTLFFPMVTTKPDGNGLGLSIAQSIVERHNGKIECDSDKGETTFKIILPLRKSIMKHEDN